MAKEKRKAFQTYGRHRLRKFFLSPGESFNLSSGKHESVLLEVSQEDKSFLNSSQQKSDTDFFALLSKSLAHYTTAKEQSSVNLDSSSQSEAIEALDCSSLLFKSFSNLHKNVEAFQYCKENGKRKSDAVLENIRSKKSQVSKKTNVVRKNKQRAAKHAVGAPAQTSYANQEPIDWNEIEQYSFVIEKHKPKSSKKKKGLDISKLNLEKLLPYGKSAPAVDENSVHELSSVTFPKIASTEPSPIYKDMLRGAQLGSWKSSMESPNFRVSQTILQKSSLNVLKNHNVKTSTPFVPRMVAKGKDSFTERTRQFQNNSVENLLAQNRKTMSKVVQTPVLYESTGHSLGLNASWQSDSSITDSCGGSRSLFKSKSDKHLSKSFNSSANRISPRCHRGSCPPEISAINFDLSGELFLNKAPKMPNLTRMDSSNSDKRLATMDKICPTETESNDRDSCGGPVSLFESIPANRFSNSCNFSANQIALQCQRSSSTPEISAELFPNQSLQISNLARIGSSGIKLTVALEKIESRSRNSFGSFGLHFNSNSKQASRFSKSCNFSTNRLAHRCHRSSGTPETSAFNLDLPSELFPNQALPVPNLARMGSFDKDRRRLTAVDKSCLEKLSYICQASKVCGVVDRSSICKPCSVLVTPLRIRSEAPNKFEYSAEKHVLDICSQDKPIEFSAALDTMVLSNCVKIGEGVYGEVFRLHQEDGTNSALKIIPIEGDFSVNGETQKSFAEILPEIVISKKLSDLSETFHNCTRNFINIQKVLCLKGKYPSHLLEEWNKYNVAKESLNDSPEIFKDDQLYIALECANGGVDLESIQLKNAEEAVSIFVQVACSLAVGEQAVQFEHRDLHWGNILVLRYKETTVDYSLNGHDFTVPTNGVFASIIDFTLSRLGKDGRIVFTDLSQDPSLFTGEGDYQFDIYRKIRSCNQNNWEKFTPYSNVLWLHYLVDKLFSEKEYKNKTSKKHKSAKQQLLGWKDTLLQYESASDFIAKAGIIDFDAVLLENQSSTCQKRAVESFNTSRKLTCLKNVNRIVTPIEYTKSQKSSSINPSVKKRKSSKIDSNNIVTRGRAIRGSVRKVKHPNIKSCINLKAYNVRI